MNRIRKLLRKHRGQFPHDDHAKMVQHESGTWVYVSQPYALGQSALKEMIAFAEANELELFIDGTSDYYPGHTIRVVWGDIKVPE